MPALGQSLLELPFPGRLTRDVAWSIWCVMKTKDFFFIIANPHIDVSKKSGISKSLTFVLLLWFWLGFHRIQSIVVILSINDFLSSNWTLKYK
jgi:hypothetical protein